MVKVADLVALYLAEIVDVPVVVTTTVLTLIVAVIDPAGTVTEEGTVAYALLLDSEMTAPEEGAGPVNVTVPVDEVPPLTVSGLSEIELSVAAVTVRLDVLVTVPSVAEIVEVVEEATAYVARVKVAVVTPAGTVTLAGTVAAAVLLLVSATTMPLVGATPLSVTVPIDAFPPITEVGFNERDDSAGGFTVRVPVLLTVTAEAVMTTAVGAETGVVVIVNVADVLPAATVTLVGTDATAGLALDRVTAKPPVGARPVSVTVPVELLPPVTVAGLRVRVDRAGGFTVSVPVLLTPPADAVTTTAVWFATGVVVIVNVADVVPAATVTVAGTCAVDALLLDSATTVPPVGAAAFSVTVPVDDAPPITEVGLSVSVLTDTVTAAKLAVALALLMVTAWFVGVKT
jgi:hypothetical protein